MSETLVQVLTPPGTGAIATIAVSGPNAWGFVQRYFQPIKKQLPDIPEVGRFWFGKFGEDEVIVAATPQAVEIHCHGGHRVVRMIVGMLTDAGAVEVRSERNPLTMATTLSTASILLDQVAGGAFRNAVSSILDEVTRNRGLAPPARLKRLFDLCPVGRHLVEPWKVAILGPPNVGKSSLMNALAGYQRSIVAPIPGTTRDVVTVNTAFDGWPVRLSDTAGIHETDDVIESMGIQRAWLQANSADLVLWIYDATDTLAPLRVAANNELIVINKCDLTSKKQGADAPRPSILVSAMKGQGIPELIDAIVLRLVPYPPEAGEAVPYTPEIADQVELALREMLTGRIDFAIAALHSALALDSKHAAIAG